MHTTRALVRPPGESFCDGLTTAGLGSPDLARSLIQHERYCEALVAAGVELVRLPADPQHADATFVEDTAIVTEKGAIITRPGAPSRQGEVESIRQVLSNQFDTICSIESPGTVDGGDVCRIDNGFLIGLSQRTNEAGAQQLAEHLEAWGFTAQLVDIRRTTLLHLKSGIAYLGDGLLIAVSALARKLYNAVPVDDDEAYAANCVRLNDTVLIPAGFPKLQAALSHLHVVPLDMSEFRKQDGGLSCLSLRW